LIDTHAHLDFAKTQEQLEELLERAWEVGLENIVTIGASREFDSNLRALEIANKYERVFATVGIHPHDARVVTPKVLEDIEALARSNQKVVAIGEIGLDYHYDHSPREKQREAFAQFIAMAHKLSLPVIIHSREAEQDTIDILRQEGAERCGGVLHCFSGTRWLAEQALDLDFYVSFSGIVTFKSAPIVQEVARMVPEDRILVETDAPFLAPVPKRGRRNEPSYVAHTLRFIAKLRGVEPEALAAVTTANARRFYGLPAS
jgi:TatD DNase family protein